MRVPSLSRGKILLFSVIPAAILLMLLAGAEVLIRVLHPEDDLALAREVRYDGIDWYETNRSALRVYFPASTPSLPELKPSLFRRQKAPGGLRIFCLGESTMFGTPYDMNANIPGIVRKQLRRLMLGREVEVVNWGASAINSNVVRDLAPAMLRFQPDAVFIYLGHNELYGPDGVGASWIEKQWPAITGWKYDLRRLRLFRAVQSLFPSPAPSREEAANLMKEVSGGHLVSSDSPDARRVYRNFESNLRAIVGVFSRAGIPVVLSDVTSNLMLPPFVSDAAGRTDSTLRLLFSAGDDAGVLARFAERSSEGRVAAVDHYWAGRALIRTGDTAGGRSALVRARDADLLKFRAPSEINDVIRRVAADAVIPCLAADSVLSSASRGGIPGDSLFWEHLHPTLRGYYLLANGYVDATKGLLALPPGQAAVVPLDPDSLSIAWMELAYADLSIRHLTGRWPFHDLRRTPVVIGDADPAALRIVSDVYDRRTSWNEGCYQSAAYFWSKGGFRKARTTYEAMLEEYAYSFYTNFLLGNLLGTSGDRRQAVPYYRRSIASNPEYPNARLELGLLLVNLSDFDGAIAQLEGLTVRSAAQNDRTITATACYGLGAAYANKGDRRKALEMLDRALALMPGYPDAERLRTQIRLALPGADGPRGHRVTEGR
jgi:tetratricopeptide (TPR) repeat protein